MSTLNILLKAMVSTGFLRMMAVASMIYSLPCNAENCMADPVSGIVYGVINQGKGTALDICHESSASGANAFQRPYKASDNQHFIISEVGNGYWTFQAVTADLSWMSKKHRSSRAAISSTNVPLIIDYQVTVKEKNIGQDFTVSLSHTVSSQPILMALVVR